MWSVLFNTFGKIVAWVLYVIIFFITLSAPVLIPFLLILLIAGPVVAIPAMLALRGAEVESSMSPRQARSAIDAAFATKGLQSTWTPTQGAGDLNFKLKETKYGAEPTVSVRIEQVRPDTTRISAWMSEYTSGGFNGGRGTPFYVWGAERARRKIVAVMATLPRSDAAGTPAGIVPAPADADARRDPAAASPRSTPQIERQVLAPSESQLPPAEPQENTQAAPQPAKARRRGLTDLSRVAMGKDGRFRPVALADDSFTWIGDWAWTTDTADPGGGGGAGIRGNTAMAPPGLCALDGTLLCEAAYGCDFGFIDSTHKAAYFGFSDLGLDPENPEMELRSGAGSVPLATVGGLQVLRRGTSSPAAIDVSPDGRTLAVLDSGPITQYGPRDYGADGFITLVDTATGRSTRLASVRHAGSSQISFSPDGGWLLIPTEHRDYGALVINATTAQYRFFPELNRAACWWVRDGHLGLLGFGYGDDETFDPGMVSFHDLTTGGTSPLVRIDDPRPGLSLPLSAYHDPQPNADGQILAARWLPDSDIRRPARGPYLSLLDLHTGQATTVIEPYVDPNRFVERRQKRWRWNRSLDLEVSSHPAILDQELAEPTHLDWPEPGEQDRGGLLRVEFTSPFLTGQFP